MPRVMLDAGHYARYNRSPAVPEYWESDMSWALQLRLKNELEALGITVGLTRPSKDGDLEVYARGRLSAGYDMFVSLHSNAVGSGVNEEVDRPVVIRLAADKNAGEELAQRFADMLHEVMQTRQPGRVNTRVQDNGAEYYGVLRGAKAAGCPHAFIIEHSFHTATAPARWLMRGANLDILARREAKIIADYFGISRTKENKTMTAEEKAYVEKLESRVAQLEDECRVYHWYEQLPDYARPVIERLHREGVFEGAGPGDMALTRNMMRILLILDKQGVFKS